MIMLTVWEVSVLLLKVLLVSLCRSRAKVLTRPAAVESDVSSRTDSAFPQEPLQEEEMCRGMDDLYVSVMLKRCAGNLNLILPDWKSMRFQLKLNLNIIVSLLLQMRRGLLLS